MCFNVEWAWSKIFEFSNFCDEILEQVGSVISMPSAKQQPSNIKHGGGIRPNVWVLTFGPLCTILVLRYDNWSELNREKPTIALLLNPNS